MSSCKDCGQEPTTFDTCSSYTGCQWQVGFSERATARRFWEHVRIASFLTSLEPFDSPGGRLVAMRWKWVWSASPGRVLSKWAGAGLSRCFVTACYSMFQHIQHRTMSPMSPRNASFAQKVRENLEDCQAEAQPANITTCDLEANWRTHTHEDLWFLIVSMTAPITRIQGYQYSDMKCMSDCCRFVWKSLQTQLALIWSSKSTMKRVQFAQTLNRWSRTVGFPEAACRFEAVQVWRLPFQPEKLSAFPPRWKVSKGQCKRLEQDWNIRRLRTQFLRAKEASSIKNLLEHTSSVLLTRYFKVWCSPGCRWLPECWCRSMTLTFSCSRGDCSNLDGTHMKSLWITFESTSILIWCYWSVILAGSNVRPFLSS